MTEIIIINVPRKGKEFINIQNYLFSKKIEWIGSQQIKEEINSFDNEDTIRLIINSKAELSWARNKQNISSEYSSYNHIKFEEIGI